MSEGEFHAYVGLLAVSAVILSVLAVRGFGQSTGARVLDGLFAAGFLGYAAYLVIADPDTVTIFFYAFAAPVLGVVHAVRSTVRMRKRHIPALPYAGEPAPVPPQPFPAPPPPRAADPAEQGSGVDDVPSPYTYRAMSSGLPSAPAAPITGPAATPPPVGGTRPSGLAGAPAFSLQESGRAYTPRPSGLPEATAPRPEDRPSETASPHAQNRPFEATSPRVQGHSPEASPPQALGPSFGAASPQGQGQPFEVAAPHAQGRPAYAPFRLGPDEFVEPSGGHRDHAEPAATAEFTQRAESGYRPAHSWHQPRHASPEPPDTARHRLAEHRLAEPDSRPPADWPPRRA
jgi:hypothetical protein